MTIDHQKIQGRSLSQADIVAIQSLIRNNPGWNRTQLSKNLVKFWDWRTANGQLKDMATRDLLVRLHERRLITLPPRLRLPPKRRRPSCVPDLPPRPALITGSLSELRPLQVERVAKGHPDFVSFSEYLSNYRATFSIR